MRWPRLWQHPGMQGVAHYENFPVASWLCPPRLRDPIVALYHYARTADDIADEGDASADQRLAELQTYRDTLLQAWQAPASPPDGRRWPEVFGPLAQAMDTHQLPLAPMLDLLDAFEQDVRYTASGQRYANLDELLDYCRRSANPVGRLLLHLYGVHQPRDLQQSDDICTALQLINFWQDLSRDLPRQRHYLPQDLLERHGIDPGALTPAHDSAAARRLVAELVAHARALMHRGAPLAVRLPGRIGWELRLVVQGGLRILELIERDQHRSWQRRPRLRATDVPVLLWRALRMGTPATMVPSTP